MWSKVLEISSQVVATLGVLVQAVERPGEGAEKRAEVIAAAQVIILALPIPAWAKVIFGNGAVLGVVVDLLVAALNKTGWFDKQAPADSPVPA